MKSPFFSALYKNKVATFITAIIFLTITGWFLYIHTLDFNTSLRIRQIWGSSYQLMAFVGGIIGLSVSRKWGGHKSLLGRAIMFFSIGLLLQTFGQSVDSYYNTFMNATIPYPSLGDFGFMGSVIVYIYGANLLIQATGFKFTIKSIKGRAVAIIVPLVLLIVCYFFFLQGYQFDMTNKVKILLDFGYPLGQALYVSMALLAYFMSRNYFDGLLRRPVVFLIAALIFQYISDFTFLYQSNANSWYVGGINDFLYFISYTLMTVTLIYFGGLYDLRNEDNEQPIA